MTRRPRHELEQADHYVYLHRNKQHEVIYVGRTANPDRRPWEDTQRRSWIKTESVEVEVSPAMSFKAAAWVENELMRAHHPKHNQQGGQMEFPADEDWRIDRIAEAEGVTRTDAKWAVRYFPEDPAEFEDFLAMRVEAQRKTA